MMRHDFIVHSLPQGILDRIQALPPEELARQNILRLQVDANPGYPCRLSLRDAEVGEAVYALSYEHQAARSPYRAAGPVFIRTNAQQARLVKNELPIMLRHRFLSLRGYDGRDMMVAAQTVDGQHLEQAIEHMFDRSAIRYLDVHNAGPGCFNCRIRRM